MDEPNRVWNWMAWKSFVFVFGVVTGDNEWVSCMREMNAELAVEVWICYNL